MAVSLLAAAPAGADDEEEGHRFSDRDFAARLGTYAINSHTQIRIDDSTGTIGTTITLEDDLNMESETSTFYAGVDWRIAGRHYLEFEHFSFTWQAVDALVRDRLLFAANEVAEGEPA